MTPLRRIFQLALLLVFFVLPGAIHAQGAELTVNVSAGYDGFYRAGKWCPVVVSISNQPKNGRPGDRSLDFTGTLVVESHPEEDDSPTINFSREILVPAFSNQRFFLYAKFPETISSKPMLAIRNEDGKKISEYPLEIQAIPTEKMLTVTVGDSLGSLAIPSMPGDLDVSTRAKVSFKSLPDSWMGLDPVDVLVVPQWDEGALIGSTRQALEDWTAMGGTLVFLGGQRTGTYGDASELTLVPVNILESARIVADSRGLEFRTLERGEGGVSKNEDAFIATKMALKDGAEVLMAANNGEPLFVRRALGAGQVLFLAFDLESSSQRFASILLANWASVMPLPNFADGEYSYVKVLRRGRSGSSGASSDGLKILTGSAGSPPNHFVISLICLIYATIVGPLNFYALSRMKRFDLAWATIPVIVVIFSALIYGLGRLTRGGSSIIREVTILHTTAGQSVGDAHSTSAAFTSGSGNFTFTPRESRTAVSDEFRWAGYEGLRTFATMVLNPIAGGALAFDDVKPTMRTNGDDVSVSEWSLRPFEVVMLQTRRAIPMTGAVDADLKIQNDTDRIRGTVTNNTGRDFKHAYLAVGGKALPLGRLENGRTVTVGADGAKGWVSLREEIQALGVPAPGSDGESDGEVNSHNAAVALEAIYYPPASGDRVFPVDRGTCRVIGISDETIASFDGNLGAEDVTHVVVTLAEVALKLDPDEKSVQCSADDLSIRLHNIPEEADWFDVDNGRLRLQKMRFVASFEIPLRDSNAEVRRLSLTSDGVAGGGQLLSYEIFNFAKRQWDTVLPDAILQNTPRRGTADYTSDCYVLPHTGRIFVLIKSEPDPNAQRSISVAGSSEIGQLGVQVEIVHSPKAN